MKKQKAITLVALIITIIILLILATVSIRLVMNGEIIGRAEKGIEAYSDEEIGEQIKLVYNEYQAERFIDSDIIVENYIKNHLEEIFNDIINVELQGKSIKINFTNKNKTYKFYSNGTVKKIMEPTNIYGMLDENNILYLRSSIKEGYRRYVNSGSIKANWNSTGDANRENIKKVIIEEPIAPTTMRWYVYIL